MKTHLLNGDVMTIPLADQSVHCIVTSPPYWGLRAYATGDNKTLELGSEPLHDCGGWVTGDDCGACFVCNVRQYAREFWRVLRDDGTWWLNLGDSYSSNSTGSTGNHVGLEGGKTTQEVASKRIDKTGIDGLKSKDLCGIPWRVALALQADGWFLRSDIIWAKPNPMPESVTDRPTKAHEYLFLLSKNKRYFYDADAVREENKEYSVSSPQKLPNDGKVYKGRCDVDRLQRRGRKARMEMYNPAGRNRRTVWNIATAPYSGAHFATFPPALVEPCIKAGTSERGCCPVCGEQWRRVVDYEARYEKREPAHAPNNCPSKVDSTGWQFPKRDFIGFRPDCDHDAEPVPCVVFDPFAGSGTTVMVANQLGRRGVGLDLSLEYLQLARERVGLAALDAWKNGIDGTGEIELGPLFAKI